MGILRTDIISHSQLSNGNASVLFDGTTDSITIPSHSAFAFGTADYTVEMFVNFTALSGQQTLVGDTYGATNGFYFYKRSDHKLGWYYDNSNYWNANTLIETDRWYHLAFVRHGGTARIYIDGVLDGEDPTDTFNATVTQYYIADTADQTSGEFFGYMSNLRITRTAVYKENFTVPKFKLKEIPGTILLALQSSSSTTEAAVSVAGTLTANGDPTATAFGPGLKEDITDTGVVFDGVTTFDSQAFMVPPSGKTTERNRGRALWAGGDNPGGGQTNLIDFIQIQSGGIGFDFGDLTAAGNQVRGVSSFTRGVFGGGRRPHPATVNTMDFVTIANTANALDFGDLTDDRAATGEISSSTRGIFAAGYNPSATNTIDFITIATLGNASDFGDTTIVGNGMAGTQSTTRGILAGAYTPSSPNTTNVIQYLTIATTGNAQDFGDLTDSRHSASGTSNGVRAVFMGGDHLSPAADNTIDFITIASTGNATDFGDLGSTSIGTGGATSDKIRGVFGLGYAGPNYLNVIQQVTIATTGNSVNIGELTLLRHQPACLGDAHGGLSE